MCRSIVSVNAWEREYLQERQRCSVKGVQIKHLVSSSVLKGYKWKILTQLSAFHLPPPGFEIWGSMPTMKSNSLCSQSLSSLCCKGQHLLNSWAAPEPCSHQGQATEQGPARQLLKVCPDRHCCFMSGRRLALGFLQVDSAAMWKWSRGDSMVEQRPFPSTDHSHAQLLVISAQQNQHSHTLYALLTGFLKKRQALWPCSVTQARTNLLHLAGKRVKCKLW